MSLRGPLPTVTMTLASAGMSGRSLFCEADKFHRAEKARGQTRCEELFRIFAVAVTAQFPGRSQFHREAAVVGLSLAVARLVRVMRVSLTDQGMTILQEARCVPLEVMEATGTPPEQLQQLNEKLKALRSKLVAKPG
ncbi:hypothetical protein [Novosphingobium sp. PP1Y]|uniref:hypothetical protein n=1 Tax=Novosphingobium sp. PP1Y TaxID=702113 RepID=UPI00187DADBB|nr:hypothetical protein [Novosphingobium sp. PP1Y]